MTQISRVLIANRGEIAVRIARTCREMGIESVAIYSDADASSPHVRIADLAVRIGGQTAAESYLDSSRILDAGRRAGTDAVHPGYGFLSENAAFARDCEDAGLIFIGPSSQAITSMGLKAAARKVAEQAGVPVVPGYDGAEQSRKKLKEEILRIGFPVLIKASAGGGGKGMRVVRDESEVDSALDSAAREAEKSFGNPDLLLERLIENARHIEIQILGDKHGNLVHLFERDCSLQRRHQKVVEECPSPAVDNDLRERMGTAAVRLARSIGYTNAGTVEFLLDERSQFYFIEVNTRLQVEHPVTEMVTGLDLVRLQFEIAAGHSLPFTQEQLSLKGHSIEARIYAEDPANGFLPSSGRIHDWLEPAGVRVDSGVEEGSEIGIHYDPMLAKVIVAGVDRSQAIRSLRGALGRLVLSGLKTNREFLMALIGTEEFSTGRAATSFIDSNLERLVSVEPKETRDALIAVVVAFNDSLRDESEFGRLFPISFRNNPYRDPSRTLVVNGEEFVVSWKIIGVASMEVSVAGLSSLVRLLRRSGSEFLVEIDGIAHTARVSQSSTCFYVWSRNSYFEVESKDRFPAVDAAISHGDAISPMPGQVLKVLVVEGDTVAVGQALVILEAMKMEQTIKSGAVGRVARVLVAEGSLVSPGDKLVHIEALTND